jgi:hypothetical protein
MQGHPLPDAVQHHVVRTRGRDAGPGVVAGVPEAWPAAAAEAAELGARAAAGAVLEPLSGNPGHPYSGAAGL